jgi:hypothetical protein
VKQFFITSKEFLSSKCGVSYAKNKLAREFDLEWQSMMCELPAISSEEIESLTKVISDMQIDKGESADEY